MVWYVPAGPGSMLLLLLAAAVCCCNVAVDLMFLWAVESRRCLLHQCACFRSNLRLLCHQMRGITNVDAASSARGPMVAVAHGRQVVALRLIKTGLCRPRLC
jgi:hypothetical protein